MALTPITASVPQFQPQIDAINKSVNSYNTSQGAPTPTTPAPATPTQTPAPTAPTAPTSTYYPRYTPQEQQASNYLGTFQAPKSVDQYQQEGVQQAQGQIDSLSKYYDSLLQQQQTVNQGRDRSTNALSVLNGLAGSSDAQQAATQTSQVNQRDNEKIMAEKNAAIQGLLGNIRQSAVQRAQEDRVNASKSAEDILATRKQRLEEVNQQATELAKSGVTIDGLKATDPTSYQHLVESLGGEAQAKAVFTLNRPQETILDKKIENGKYVIAYQNPLDGKTRIETLDLGLPPQYTKTVDTGDKILAIPDGWDGDPSKLITVNKGMSPEQKDTSARGWAEIGIKKDAAANPGIDDPNATTDATSRSILAQTGLSYGAFQVLTGNMSSLPRDAKTRNAAMKEAQEFANKKGVDISTLGAQYGALNKTLSFNTVRASMAQVQENEIQGTVKNLEAVAPTGQFSGLNSANAMKILAGQQVNDPVAQQYAFHLEQIRNEIVAYNLIAQGQINPDGSLKQATKEDLDRANSVIKNGIAKGSLQGLSTAVENSTAKMKPILKNSQTAAQKAVWDLFGVSGNFDSSHGQSSGKKVIVKNGQAFDASSLTPEEYQQALKDGYTTQ